MSSYLGTEEETDCPNTGPFLSNPPWQILLPTHWVTVSPWHLRHIWGRISPSCLQSPLAQSAGVKHVGLEGAVVVGDTAAKTRCPSSAISPCQRSHSGRAQCSSSHGPFNWPATEEFPGERGTGRSGRPNGWQCPPPKYPSLRVQRPLPPAAAVPMWLLYMSDQACAHLQRQERLRAGCGGAGGYSTDIATSGLLEPGPHPMEDVKDRGSKVIPGVPSPGPRAVRLSLAGEGLAGQWLKRRKVLRSRGPQVCAI